MFTLPPLPYAENALEPVRPNFGLQLAVDLGVFYLKHHRVDDADQFFVALRDQPPRKPTFDLQFFFGELFANAEAFLCPQRYALGLGSPIWSRMRQTTVSTMASTEPGRL